MKEANLQRLIQIEASQHDVLLLRNNIGQYRTEDGAVIKYGVGGPGWPDLLGITPVTITPAMVGRIMGVFTAMEIKTPTGRPSKRQLEVINAIRERYAITGIARSTDEVLAIINEYKG